MPDHDELNLLEGLAPKRTFARGIGSCDRTVDNYRKEPDGLPSLTIGGRVYIPIKEGREWIMRRMTRPNPSRPRTSVANDAARQAERIPNYTGLPGIAVDPGGGTVVDRKARHHRGAK